KRVGRGRLPDLSELRTRLRAVLIGLSVLLTRQPVGVPGVPARQPNDLPAGRADPHKVLLGVSGQIEIQADERRRDKRRVFPGSCRSRPRTRPAVCFDRSALQLESLDGRWRRLRGGARFFVLLENFDAWYWMPM